MALQPAKDSVDVGILVCDIKKSLDFYQGILGLEKIEELPTAFGTLHRLRYGTSDIKLIAPKAVPPTGPIGLEKQLGIRYLTFVIRDLRGLCATLKEKGVEFTMPETQIRPGTRIAMVKDPDGNIVEFVERG
jgi:catechol 2,3-dioxygenase-like lactoylglutathione lyase family enzyme